MATGSLLLAMVIEGLIPDDVEYAFAEQQAIQKRIDAEFEQYGRFVFPDRNTGVYRLGLLGNTAERPLMKPTRGI